MKNKGFSILELFIVLTITSIVSIGAFSGFKYFSYSIKSNQAKTKLLKESQVAMAYLTKDIGYAINIDNSYLPGLGVTPPYVNENDKLCIRIPSVDENNNPVLDDGPPLYTPVTVGLYSDYIYFYKEGTQIKKEIIVNSSSPYTSARAGEVGKIFIVADDVQSLVFSDFSKNHTPHTINEINTLYSGAALTTYIEEISKLGITVTFQKIIPNSKEITKTMKTQVYALRNKA